MNSKLTYNQVGRKTYSTNNLPIPTIKFNIPSIGPGDSITPTIEMKRLVCSKRQDVHLWLKEFYLTASDCSWDEVTSLKALKLLLGKLEDREMLEGYSNFTNAMRALIDKYFPPTDFNHYLNKLESLKRADFKSVNDFYNTFKSLTEKTNYCCKSSEKLTTRELFTLFIKALPYKEKELILREGITKTNEAVTRIALIEETLARFCPENSVTATLNVSNARKPMVTSKPNMTKFCAYHKNCNHTTKNCKKLDELKSKEKTLFTRDSSCDVAKISTDVTVNKSSENYTAYLDTDSTYSIISGNLVKLLCLSDEVKPTNKKIFGIGDKQLKVDGILTTSINFVHIANQTFNIKFLVAEVPHKLVLIGNDFMNANYVKIDFGKYLLTIDNKPISFAEEGDLPQGGPDYELLEKSNVYFNSHVEMEKTLTKYFPNPDALGNIKQIEHTINLETPKVFSQKPYRLNDKMNKLVQKEIKNWRQGESLEGQPLRMLLRPLQYSRGMVPFG